MTKKENLYRLIPSITIVSVCLIFTICHIEYHLYRNSGIADRVGYIFTHTSIFHLLINTIALFRFKPRLKTCIIAMAVSFAVTFIPFIHLSVPTCGMSGFLMACFARYYQAWRKPVWKFMLANLAFIPVPLVNWRIHIVSFIISYTIYAYLHKSGN